MRTMSAMSRSIIVGDMVEDDESRALSRAVPLARRADTESIVRLSNAARLAVGFREPSCD